MHLDHGKQKIRFSIFGFSHRLCRRAEVTVGSEDQLQIFLRAYLFRRGQMEHVLIMASLKLKPSLFTPRPSV